MSLDSSLKGGNNLTGHRSVLKRHERLEKKLREGKGFDPEKQPLIGMPKTKNLKIGK